MKKAYVKPVMESEEFVANEYVAACWYVNCTYNYGFIGCNYNKLLVGGNYSSFDEYYNAEQPSAFHKGVSSHQHGWTGLLGYENPNYYYHEAESYSSEEWNHHLLKISKKGDGTTPNAS